MLIADTAHLVVGLLVGGTGLIFLRADPLGRASRVLAICLVAIGLDLVLDTSAASGVSRGWLIVGGIGSAMLEVVGIIAGVEWGRRIAETATGWSRKTANALFRAAQILMLVYGGLILGYFAISPDLAATDPDGLVKVRPLEFAIFAPIIGTAMGLTTLAITILLFVRVDPTEKIRLRSLMLAGPFLLAGLIVNERWEPLTMAIGFLIFLAGAVRYLIMQGQRGQFMSQFLSPEVAGLVRIDGMDSVLKRERRVLSVVACDLRGFTAYARARDSHAVVSLLERYYAAVGEIAATHGGSIKDHAGDGVLILVGAPVAMDDHAERALRLSRDLVEQLRPLLAELAPELGLGVGVATGTLTVGAIHGAGRLEYVAVGNAVNLASRLCDRALDGEVLSDQRTLQGLGEAAGLRGQARDPQPLKGFPEPIPVAAVVRAAAC